MSVSESQVEMLAQFLELARLLNLEDKTYEELQEEVRDAVLESGVDDVDKALESLRGYRVVDALELSQHDYVRWIRSENASPSGRASGPTVGGVVTSVHPAPEGQHTVRCVGRVGRFFQVTTRPGVWLFRLLTEQEVVILNVLEALDQGSREGPTLRPVSPS
jgi:hypothetical protein